MKKYQVIQQHVGIGWKETDSIGDPEISYVEAENLTQVLSEMGFIDGEDDENTEDVENILEELEKSETFMTNEAGEYWADPEPCDAYLTYGYEITIHEMTPEEIQAEVEEKNAKRDKNNKKWDKWCEGKGFSPELVQELYSLKFKEYAK